MKKETVESMIARATALHGAANEYLREDLTAKQRSLVGRCKLHGLEFSQSLTNILKGSTGCPECVRIKVSHSKSLTLEEVVDKTASLPAHQNLTYLSLSRKDKVTFITASCPRHGEFTQNLPNHLNGATCPGCVKDAKGPRQRLTVEELQAASKHEVIATKYEGGVNLATAKCSKHGEFTVLAGQLNSGRDCPKCVEERKAYSLESLKAKAKEVGSDLEYTRLDRSDPTSLKVEAICKEHGEFLTKVSIHLRGRRVGCPKCADDVHAKRLQMSEEGFKERLKAKHGDTYKFVQLLPNRGGPTKAELECKEHGKFVRGAWELLNRQGCPKCSAGGNSLAGKQFFDAILKLAPDAVPEVSLGSGKYRWDVVVPSKQLAFEFHGVYWHSDKYRKPSYHLEKHRAGLAAGYRTVHIFEDEWEGKNEVVLGLIANLVKPSGVKVFARKSEVSAVSSIEAREFLTKYHIQGAPASSQYLSLTRPGEVVAVIGYCLKESGRKGRSMQNLEITRFASSLRVVGGFSKLLRELLRRHPTVTKVHTFSDVRMFSGEMYKAAGFAVAQTLAPDYWYVKGDNRVHKSRFQKSRFKADPKLLYQEDLTESELARLNGLHRVYDCGKLRWEYTVS